MFAEATPAAEPTRFLRIRDVLNRVPVSRATIYRLMGKDKFPKSFEVGSTSFWLESEVVDWMQAKVDNR